MHDLVEVRGLCKQYDSFSLQDVNFTLPEGCITGFIGVNGAGKTTTIKAILGLINVQGGSISAFGEEMGAAAGAIKNRIGVVLDSGSFYEDFTMGEMRGIIAPAYSKWNDADFRHYMDRFSLDHKQKISTLSKGMRMKYALALALSHGAELLIMDEPTSGLDPLIRSELLAILGDYMKRGGRGVFFSTHITSDLDKVADMLILIDEGRVIFQDEKDALLERHRIVMGDSALLTPSMRKLFLRTQVTEFGFEGITDRVGDVKAALPDAIFEKATIDDIMLAYIKGGGKS